MKSKGIDLPSQLQNPNFRFIKLGSKDERLKVPIEIGWNIFGLEKLKAYIEEKATQWDADETSDKHAEMTTKGKYVPKRPTFRGRLNNYVWDESEFQEWLSSGKNYGVTSAGGLIKLESDDIGRWAELGVLSILPETFTVQSSTPNRQHFYFFGPEVADSPLLDPKTGEDIGHIRGTGEAGGRGGMIVGPGSLHPSGVRYTVFRDLPIAIITQEQLDKIKVILSKPKRNGESGPKKNKNPSINQKNATKQITNSNVNIRIEDIAMPVDPVRDDGEEIQGSQPVHGSETGKNFSINPSKNNWHCFRCDSGGGPLEWIAVEAELISCSEAGPGCLRGKRFKEIIDATKESGFDVSIKRQRGTIQLIEKRINCDTLPEDLPIEQVVVVKAPPRIGKTHWAVEQLIKSGSGNYVTHNHAIVGHAVNIFKNLGGQSAVWLEGKSRQGMCRRDKQDCKDCELYPNQQDNSHISYLEAKRRAEELLREKKILTEANVPADLCPYYTLKLAEESAHYCFTVVHFIEDIEARKLTVIDEDPTLKFFYPASVEVLSFKRNKNEFNIVNNLYPIIEPIRDIRSRIDEKKHTTETDKALLWAIDQVDDINSVIEVTMSANYDLSDCYRNMAEQAGQKCEVSYEVREKAINKVEDHFTINQSSDLGIRELFSSVLFPYEKAPLYKQTSSGNGYGNVYLIGDASRPIINMHWTHTADANSDRKILIIGNSLAELFGSALGNAIVIEICRFKYASNYIVIPVDSSGENTYDGKVKNQRLKVRKMIRETTGNPDGKSRHPVMVLTGSKEHQNAIIRSIGGIAHAAQQEGEVGQKWNYRSGAVNVFYQNSVISRGLDVDQYNVLFVHDVDFRQPFWSAAMEAGEEKAEAISNSIAMDETTNSVLRISPVVGGNKFRPKFVIIPRIDLWKVKYIDDQVLGGNGGGRTPDVRNIATVIREANIVGTVQLNDEGGISAKDELKSPDWDEAVRDNNLLHLFKHELDKVANRDKCTDEERNDAMDRILKVMRKAGKSKWLSIKEMREHGLRCKDALIRPALGVLSYQKKVHYEKIGKRSCWSLINSRNEPLPASDFGNFEGAA